MSVALCKSLQEPHTLCFETRSVRFMWRIFKGFDPRWQQAGSPMSQSKYTPLFWNVITFGDKTYSVIKFSVLLNRLEELPSTTASSTSVSS